MLRSIQRIVGVEVNEEDLRRVRELKGQRVILAPNHSGKIEPYILFHLSKLLGEEFTHLLNTRSACRMLALEGLGILFRDFWLLRRCQNA